jgi:hypothetical protein
MNLPLEKQRRSPEAVSRLVSVLKGMDRLTVTVMAAPTEQPRAKETSSCDCPDLHPHSGLEDDLANATWEDAEWQ